MHFFSPDIGKKSAFLLLCLDSSDVSYDRLSTAGVEDERRQKSTEATTMGTPSAAADVNGNPAAAAAAAPQPQQQSSQQIIKFPAAASSAKDQLDLPSAIDFYDCLSQGSWGE